MVKDAFDRWCEWVERPPGSDLTIPGSIGALTMILTPLRNVD
jgi:hypothetical protein